MDATVEVRKILLSLPPWPDHELKWLAEQLGKSQQEVIREAIIHYAHYWKEHYEKSGGQSDVD